jgi:predicted nucleic acid-binding protein
MVVIDTSVIIDHLRCITDKETYFEKLLRVYQMDNLSISLITVQELYVGKSSLDNDQENRILSIISPLSILPYNYQVAKSAGELVRDSKEIIQFADAAIAATAIQNNASLATLNIKDFKKINKIKLLDLQTL